MTPMPQCTNIADTLSVMTHGGPEWATRIVTMNFSHQAQAWVTVYPVIGNDSPYFDFAYPNEARPQATLAGILELHNHCEVIDWSPGRLACIQAKGASDSQLAEIIAEVAREVFGMNQFAVEASYEDMQRAPLPPLLVAAGGGTPVARPNPSVKGMPRKRAAPYVER